MRELSLETPPGGQADLLLLVGSGGQPRFVLLPLEEPERLYGRETIGTAVRLLGMEPEEVGVFAIVTLRRDATGLTGVPNLRAPLLIDMIEGRGEQMILRKAEPKSGRQPTRSSS